MWWKLLLLTLYLAVLLMLSRILEVVAYYEAGYLASRLLDPVSLSVRKLKTLLDQRGVSYAGVVEKQELTDLVEASGEVTEGEMEAATSQDEETPTSTNFTCGSHFYEEVEDTKDSVWVVQVIRDQSDHFLRSEDWKAFVKRVGHFGVRTGIFDCSLDWRLCDRKNWHTSRLVMALPQGHRAKDNVILRSYTASTKVQAVFDWVNFNLASRIREIYNSNELRKEWFAWEDVKHHTKIRIVLFSHMKIAPMFFSVLSVKFTGRAKFGTVNVNTKEGKNILNRLRFKKLPKYLVVTPEGNFTFGERSGEYLNYNSMALFFRTLHPEVNDIFLLSLILVNVACWFELFITQGNFFKRIGNMLWSVVKWNCVLILLWLPTLALLQLPYMESLMDHVLKVLRIVGMTSFSAHIRSDWLWYLSFHCGFLLIPFVIYATIVGILSYMYHSPESSTTTTLNNNSDWWNFNWDGYVNYLFRPMATLTQPMATQDMDLEVGMELLIERLAVPNFWLRPMISSDYVKDLPLWKYSGHSIDSDICSDGESTKSDGEDACGGIVSPMRSMSAESLRKLPYIFTCEKCRALQNARQSPKTEQELEEEQMDRESECAKFLMDGDYRCSCKTSKHGGESRAGRHSSRGPSKTRARSLSPVSSSHFDEEEVRGQDDDISNQMPAGMLAVSECVICLENYVYGVMLCGLPCGHSFHHQCIMEWLSRDNHCCPVCRWPTYKAKPCSIHLHAE